MPQRDRPPELMLQQAAKPRRCAFGGDHDIGKRDAATACGNALAELEIVGAEFDQRLEPADFLEARARRGHRRAERECQAFQPAGNEHTGGEVGCDANRFDVGCHAAVRGAAIETGDGADLRVAKWRRDGAQIPGRDAGVAVADHQQVVSRLAGKAAELVHLAARPELLNAGNEPNRPVRKALDQIANDRDRGIFRLGNREQHLVDGIILAAEAGEVLEGAAIEAPHGLEDAHRGREFRPAPRAALAEITSGGIDSRDVVNERQ